MTICQQIMGELSTFSLIGAQDRAIALALADRRNEKAVFRSLWLALFTRGYHKQAGVLSDDARDVYELNVLCIKSGKRGAK